jgi:regulatory protein
VDAYTAALTLLSRRELSTEQLRERLARRKFPSQDIARVIERLTADRTLDDRRVALAMARSAVSLKGQGRRRVLQRIQQIGIDSEIAANAVHEVFEDIDEGRLLDRAIEKRLKGASPASLTPHDRVKLVRHLVGRGFDASQTLARLRRKGADLDEEAPEGNNRRKYGRRGARPARREE